jgi:Domain of unknown function (DUF4189)
MSRLLKLLGAVSMSLGALAACGGGNSDPTPYGAIAWDGGRPSAAIVVHFASQPQANAAAIKRCGGDGCAVIHEFSGKGSCAALAVGGGSPLVTGVASGASQGAAEAAAVEACSAKGGRICTIPNSLPGKCM